MWLGQGKMWLGDVFRICVKELVLKDLLTKEERKIDGIDSGRNSRADVPEERKYRKNGSTTVAAC